MTAPTLKPIHYNKELSILHLSLFDLSAAASRIRVAHSNVCGGKEGQ
jgi:hypothetical protein